MPHPRVLQIGKHFYPDVGGIETVTRNISDALQAVGIGADVLCMALHSTGDRQEAGYRVMRCRSNAVLAGNKTFSWDYVRKVGQLSAQYDVGILHVPNPLGAAAVLAGWRKPLIVLWHADFDHRVLGKATRPLDIAIARRADAVVAPTSVHLTASNRAAHLVSKGEVIPFPFAPPPARKAGSSSLLVERIRHSAGGRPVVLATGRLVPYKGFDVLIRAMGLVEQDLYCVIAGGGPIKGALERQIEAAGLGHKVVVTGQIADDDMAGLVELAHFGCLPSVTAQEMYGLTQVEMMAAGKPVVSTDLAGSGVPLVNRHGKTGLLARPGNAEDLARQLAALATDEALYRRLAEGAAQAFRTEYSLRSVGERYASLITRLTGGG
jgi:glycosyltransferase involved in cell wall biosynthesis